MSHDTSLAGTIIATLLDDAGWNNEMEDFSLVAGDIIQTLADNPDALIELLVAAGEEGVAEVLGPRPKYDPKDHFYTGAYAEWGRLCNLLSGKIKRGGPQFEVTVEKVTVEQIDGASDPGLLTEAEHEVIDLLGQAASSFSVNVVGYNPSTRFADIDEFCSRIHDLQARVMMQAAARAYPDRYRLAGGVIEKSDQSDQA